MRHLTICLSCFTLLILSGFGALAHADEAVFRSPDEFLLWIENYARRPEPERIPVAFRSIQRTALVRISPDFALILGGFFATAFQRHPERVDDWVAAIARDLDADSVYVFRQTLWLAGWPETEQMLLARQSARLQETNAPIWLSKPLAALAPADGAHAVLVWMGAFFVDHDAAPIERVIGALHGFPQGENLSAGEIDALRKAFQLLTDMVPKFPRIREICENALRATDDPQIAEGLRRVLEVAKRSRY